MRIVILLIAGLVVIGMMAGGEERPDGPYQATMSKDHFACMDKKVYKQYSQHVVEGNREAFNRIATDPRCFISKGGEQVTVLYAAPGIGLRKINYKGSTFLVAMEAVE